MPQRVSCADTPTFWQSMSDMDDDLLALQSLVSSLKRMTTEAMQGVGSPPKRTEKRKALSMDEMIQSVKRLLSQPDKANSWELAYALEDFAEMTNEHCKDVKMERDRLVKHVVKAGACPADEKAVSSHDQEGSAKSKKTRLNTKKDDRLLDTKKTEARPDQTSSCICRNDRDENKSRHMSHQCGIMEEAFSIALHPDGTPCQCWQYV